MKAIFLRHAGPIVAACVLVPAYAGAQITLTLEEAMARARLETPDARALAASEAEAAARVEQARARYFPRVDLSESIQHGDQPVYVFGSLLSQRRFTEANFDVGTLNEPEPLTNVRTAITLDQRVYDAGTVRLGVRAAELQRDLTMLERSAGAQDLALVAARAFVRVLQLEAADRAHAAAVAAAESDLERAQRRRDVGLVTDADVLAVDVHLAEMRQQHITTAGDLAIARVELADALGLPLDTPVTLVRPTARAEAAEARALTREALAARPEQQRAVLRVQLAETNRSVARSAFLPRVGVQAGWEFNGESWRDQRSGWLVGARVDVNIFNGLADRARFAEASQASLRATANREQVSRRIEVEVRTAVSRLAAARARDTVGRASLAQARESQRIIRDRYEAGLATVTDVLRASEVVLDAESRATAAEMDVILEAVVLDRAVGRL